MQALTKDVLVAKQPVTSHFIRMIGSNIRTNEWSYFQANCAGQSDVYWIYTHGKLPHVLSLDSICIVILFCGKVLLHYSSKYSKIYWQKTLFIKRVIKSIRGNDASSSYFSESVTARNGAENKRMLILDTSVLWSQKHYSLQTSPYGYL